MLALLCTPHASARIISKKRIPVVALDSSLARMPLPRVAMYLAVARSSSLNGLVAFFVCLFSQ
jgi:hypothetical protein